MRDDETVVERAGELVVRLVESPVLPLLGCTKCVECVVAGGPLVGWVVWTLVASALFVVGDDLARTLDDVTDAELPEDV